MSPGERRTLVLRHRLRWFVVFGFPPCLKWTLRRNPSLGATITWAMVVAKSPSCVCAPSGLPPTTLPFWGPLSGEKAVLHARGPCVGEKSIRPNKFSLVKVFIQILPCRGVYSGAKSIWLHHPYIMESHIGKKSICLHKPCLLRVPLLGRNQYGYMAPVFQRKKVQKRHICLN